MYNNNDIQTTNLLYVGVFFKKKTTLRLSPQNMCSAVLWLTYHFLIRNSDIVLTIS